MHVHAGTVIGGSELRSGPQVPHSIKADRFGIASRYRSNTNRGAAQSSPTTIMLCLPIRVALNPSEKGTVPFLFWVY